MGQKSYFKAIYSFEFPINKTNDDNYFATYRYVGNELKGTITMRNNQFSFGKGKSVGFAWGRKTKSMIGYEFEAKMHRSNELSEKSNEVLMNSDEIVADFLQEFTFEGKMYSISPTLVFYLLDKEDATIYVKNGIIFGNCSYKEKGEIQERVLYIPSQNRQSNLEYTYKFLPKWSVGNKTGIGFDIGFSKVVRIFLESNFNYIQYKPDKAEREEYNCVDEYGLFEPSFPSEIEFIDEYTYEEKEQLGFNRQQLKRSVSFSSFDFQTGLKLVW